MADNLSVSLDINGRVNRSLLSSVNSTKASLAQLSQSLRQLREADKQAKNLARLETALDGTRKSLKASTARYAELSRAMRLVSEPSAELRRNFKLAFQENEKLKASFRSQVGRISELRRSMKGAGLDTRNLAAQQQALSAGITRASAAQQRLLAVQAAGRANSQTLSTAYGRLLEAGALGFGFARSIQPAIAFEAAMAAVGKVTGATGQDLDALSQQVQALAADIPLTQEELAQLAEAGGKFGIDTVELPDFVAQTAKIAAAFDLLPEEAGKSLAQLASIFQIPIANIGELGGAIDLLADSSATSEAEIIAVLRNIGAASSGFGLTVRQTTALADTFLALGLSSGRSSTSINAFLNVLQTAEQRPPRVAEGLKSLGVELNTLAADIQANPQQSIFDLLQRLSELDSQARTVALTKIFGTEFQDELGTVVQGLDLYREQVTRVTGAQQLAQRIEDAYSAKLRTTQAQLTLTSNGLRQVAIDFGTALLPALRDVVAGLQSATAGISAFAKTYPEITAGIGLVVSGLVGLRLAVIAGGLAFAGLRGAVIGVQALLARFAALNAVSAISGIGAAASGAAIGVGALTTQLKVFAVGATRLAPLAAFAGGTLAVVSAMEEATAALKSRREAGEAYTKGLRDQIQATEAFANVQQRNAQALSGQDLTDYADAIDQQEQYWRARVLLEADATGQTSQLTRQRWEAALEELRILKTVGEGRTNLQAKVIEQESAITESEKRTTANLQANVAARNAAYETEKAALAEVQALKTRFANQVDQARAALAAPTDNLATGTPLEAIRALDAARAAAGEGDFTAAQAAAAQTVQLVQALVEAGTLSKSFGSSLLDQAAQTGTQALTALEQQRAEAASRAQGIMEAAQAELAAFEAALQAKPMTIKVAVEQDSLTALQAQLQSFLLNNPVTLPVTGAGTQTVPAAPGLASGGPVTGPGTGTSDNLLRWLSNGEFVTRARAVQHYGVDFFRRLNSLQIPKMATGGLVGKITVPQLAGAGGGGPQFTVQIGGDAFDLVEQGGREAEFVSMLKQTITKRGRRR